MQFAQGIGMGARHRGAERFRFGDELHQPIEQGTGRTQQEKPEQQSEPAAECGPEQGVDQGAPVQCKRRRRRIRRNFLQRGNAAVAISRRRNGGNVGIEIARSPAVEQDHGCQQEGRQAIGTFQQQQLHTGEDQYRQADGPPAAMTAAPGLTSDKRIEIAAQPAFEPAVVPQPAQLRDAVAENDGNQQCK